MDTRSADQRDMTQQPAVLLFSMPWASPRAPAFSLAILRAQLQKNGIPCRVANVHAAMLKYMDPAEYTRVADLFGFNDFVFGKSIEADASPEQIAAVRQMVNGDDSLEIHLSRSFLHSGNAVDYALTLRNTVVPSFLDDCMKIVAETPATLIGFTCQFDQTLASLALAALVKQRFPEKKIVLGGYALEEPVASLLLRCFPMVDAIVLGDGEELVVELARVSADYELFEEVVRRRAGTDSQHCRKPIRAPKLASLDNSPAPDYSDWFSDLEQLKTNCGVELKGDTLIVESSRGCWWGQVAHCIFCGIDEETLKYRAKSPECVEAMLHDLREKFGDVVFYFSDYILPRTYYKTLLPRLAKREPKLSLYWQIKSNMSAEDVRIMRDAGVGWVTVGIESLSTSLLKKIDKGVTGIQNVLTIKLLQENRIDTLFNLLYGYPHENATDYEGLSERVPLLYHLTPPASCMAVLSVRYSPLYEDPARFGIAGKPRVMRRYDMIFSEDYRRQIGFDVNDYGYTFERPYEYKAEVLPHHAVLRLQVADWQNQFKARDVRLSFKLDDSHITFKDSRFSEQPTTVHLGIDVAMVHGAVLHAIQSRSQLQRIFADQLSPDRVDAAISQLIENRLLYQEGERFLALALPEQFYVQNA
jgi:ribosomal peptide maturation radical SAM protein 1